MPRSDASYVEDDLMPISGIQHFVFCKRQWALIHLENTWSENVLTVEGDLMHERAHDESSRERRGDTLIVRGLNLISHRLGLCGKTDVVEFHQASDGHPLPHEEGLWVELPIEYKRGASKLIDADRMQLCAQALCLEDMFVSDIPFGYLFYGRSKKREKVIFDEDLRNRTLETVAEMRRYYERRWVPKARSSSRCRSCSLVDDCLPELEKRSSASSYVKRCLDERAPLEDVQ